ncbi:MAG: hypothetical protein DLM59_16850 [Pseudonocardiales bacterium]|nr:MAG: hypothetical protein DLM59_16850 [Pseudonocardiales bacterium]
MTDLHTMLTRAGRPGAAVPNDVVDADVARGQRALTRRRMRRGGTRVALVAAAAVGAIVLVNQPGAPSAQAPPAAGRAARTVVPPQARPIKLVDYTGRQPDGYTVDSVPAGWEIQGVNDFVLTIGAVGDPDKNVDSFVGKLVVMLASTDETPLTTGTRVVVGAGTGLVSRDDPATALLSFRDAAGHWIDVQVPAALHWTDAQIGAFGGAVHVNATAQPGHG